MTEQGPGPARNTWQQVAALLLGVGYFLLGMLGFFVLQDTTTATLAGHDTGDVLVFLELNGIANVLHLVLGVVGMVCATTLARARGYGVLQAVVGGALFLFGLFAVGDPAINVLSLNWGDNILHLLTALVGLGIAVGRVGDRAASAPDGQ
jgi:hypothetical protein